MTLLKCRHFRFFGLVYQWVYIFAFCKHLWEVQHPNAGPSQFVDLENCQYNLLTQTWNKSVEVTKRLPEGKKNQKIIVPQWSAKNIAIITIKNHFKWCSVFCHYLIIMGQQSWKSIPTVAVRLPPCSVTKYQGINPVKFHCAMVTFLSSCHPAVSCFLTSKWSYTNDLDQIWCRTLQL